MCYEGFWMWRWTGGGHRQAEAPLRSTRSVVQHQIWSTGRFFRRESGDGFRNRNEVKFMAHTGKGLKRLAARTAGAMEAMVMVVSCRGDKIRE